MASIEKAEGGWVVVRGTEKVAGPFASEEEATAAQRDVAVTVAPGLRMDDVLGHPVEDDQ
jgi:hypothetical protein